METREKLIQIKTVSGFEKCALDLLTGNAKLYFCSEAAESSRRGSNEEAFRKYRIRPRVLRGASDPKLDCKILGKDFSSPIGISPLGLHSLAHNEAEKATASGCCNENCIFIMSEVSTCTIEEVRNKVFSSPKVQPTLWMQLYFHWNRSETLELMKKAESLGFSAIVITVDGFIGGLWKRHMPDSFFDEVESKFGNLTDRPGLLMDTSITFEDLKWLKKNTKLPVVVKGILTGDDARTAVEYGASAIIVSNHGGRILERVVSTIDVLEDVVNAVKEYGVDVYIDSGVRCGSDVFVALALGAKGVFIGRPAIWGLTVGGEKGVERVLQLLKEETLMTMRQAGASRIEDIERSMVMKIS